MRTGALALAVLLGASGAARAEPPQSETRIRHYGWQVLAADAAAIGVGFFTVPDNAWAYLIGYGFGAPAVHFGHRNPGRASFSFTGRLLMLGLVASQAGGGSGDQSNHLWLAIGGTVAFMLADAALAWDRCPVPRATRALRPVAMPAGPTGWTLGLSGQF